MLKSKTMKNYSIHQKKLTLSSFVFLLVFYLISLQSSGQKYMDISTPEVFFEMLNNKQLTYQQKVNNADAYFKKHGKEGMFKKYYKFYRRWEVRTVSEVGPNGYVVTEAEAQKILAQYNKTARKSAQKGQASQWKSIGPFKWRPGNTPCNPGIGRINNFAVEPKNQQLIYACSETGGIWKSTDAGQSWEAKGDDLEIMDIRGIGISPADNNTVFFIDKEANILKSTNGGDSWSKIFDGSANGVGGSDRPLSIIFDPNDNKNMLVSTGQGMVKSTDGGNTFKAYSKDKRFEDVLYKPGSSSVVYASGRAFYKSTDGGETFSEITSGIKYSGKERTKIAVSEADPNVVYMIQANVGGVQPGGGTNYFQTMGAIYKSTDSGNSFSVVYDSRDAADKDLLDALAMRNMMIAVNNKDANMVFVGGQFAHYRSTDGAKTFKNTGDWSVDSGTVPVAYVHADIETGKYINGNMYIGSDGGFFRSKDNQDTFEDLTQNGISVRQFYRIGLCKSNPDLVGGGSQDNGMSYLDMSKNLSIAWEGGDGYEMLIDYENPKTIYSTDLYSTTVSKSIDGGITRKFLENQPTGGSITAFAMDPADHKVIYRGFGHNLYKNTNQGEKDAWVNITPSVGSDTGEVDELAITESNNNYIYIVKKKGHSEFEVWGTKNAQSSSPSWAKLYSTTSSRINYIAADPNDPDRVAFVTSSGKVEMSTDAGANWKNITRNLPGIVGKTLAFDNKSNNGLYVGMLKGIYYTNDSMNEWMPFNNGLPNVRISEIEIHHSADKIVVGTYGRGAWEAKLYGSNNGQDPPVANFTADKTSVKIEETVTFKDQSSNNPTSWLWTFDGGTPMTSTNQNPSITYATEGTYKVTLTAKNAVGDNTKVKENYIIVKKETTDPTCTDGIQNGDETGVDCGGSCKPCDTNDTQAPSVPLNVSASNITENSVELSWTASTDNVKVTGYDVYQGDSMVTSVTGISANITGLSANTTYQFKVKAKDAAGNMSGFSTTVDVKTTTTDGNNICDGVATWDSTIFYQTGDLVVYNGNLYKMKANGNWSNQGPCENVKENRETSSLVISPVPVEDLLNIQLNASKLSTFKIVNLQGEIIRSGAFKPSIYVGDLSQGVYLIIVNDQQNRKVHKTRFLKK